MDQETQTQLVNLLQEAQVATLAVLVDGAPYTSLVPFVIRPDFLAIWIHASDLARHTRGLLPGAQFSLLIHAPLQHDQDPLQVTRVSLQGTVDLMEKESQPYPMAQEVYTAKYPQSAMMFSFKDFNIYQLQISKGRFVAGFAKAYNLSTAGMEALGRDMNEK